MAQQGTGGAQSGSQGPLSPAPRRSSIAPAAVTVPGMIHAILETTDLKLELLVEGYEFPHFDTGPDGNALLAKIELDLTASIEPGSFHSSQNAILYTNELQGFTDQLRALAHEQTGQATLGSEEPGETLSLTIELSEAGKGTIQGSLATTDATKRLTFQDIDIDHAFVHDTLTGLQEITDAFPVRGDPHAD